MTWLRAEWDRMLAVILIVAGAAALVFGYWGIAHARYTLDGMAFLVSGGLGGLFLLGLGATLLLSADLHDEWRKFDRIEAALAELAEHRTEAPVPVPDTPVLNRLGVLAVDAGVPAGRPARRLGWLGLGLAVLCGGGGFWLTAQADTARVGAGGIAVAAVGVLVVGVVAVTQILRLRRALRRRERRLFLPLVQR
jgi:hypothetical protein